MTDDKARVNCNETKCKNRLKKSGHVTCDCVSELNLISIILSAISPQSKPYVAKMARKPSSRPFAAPRSHNLKSENPRTIQNREYRLAKRGIELSELRDDGAFRTSKSRALKKLRTSDGWVKMSHAEQEKAEEEVVRQLEEKRDAKKRAHEKEWFHKVENDEIDSDEDDKTTETNVESKEDEEVDTGGEDEWFTEDNEGSDDEDWKGGGLDFVDRIIEVRRRAGSAFIEGLKKAEELAVKKEQERME